MVTRAWLYLLGVLLFVGSTHVWCSIEETWGSDFVPQGTPHHELMPRVDSAKLPGSYDYWGTRLTLNSDGTYVALWHDSHCGNGGEGKVAGKWRVSARTLLLTPISETGWTEPIPRELNIFEWGERDVVFVPRGQTLFEPDRPQHLGVFHQSRPASRLVCAEEVTAKWSAKSADSFRKSLAASKKLLSFGQPATALNRCCSRLCTVQSAFFSHAKVRVDPPAENAYCSPAFRQVDRFS
jgi:hypothetical protein